MPLHRIEKVAEELDVSVPRAYALVREGILPSVHLGRQIRVSDEALRKFVASGGKALDGGWRREPGSGT